MTAGYFILIARQPSQSSVLCALLCMPRLSYPGRSPSIRPESPVCPTINAHRIHSCFSKHDPCANENIVQVTDIPSFICHHQGLSKHCRGHVNFGTRSRDNSSSNSVCWPFNGRNWLIPCQLSLYYPSRLESILHPELLTAGSIFYGFTDRRSVASTSIYIFLFIVSIPLVCAFIGPRVTD